MRLPCALGFALFVCAVFSGWSGASAKERPDPVGAYRFEDGQIVTVSRSAKDTYRYRNLHTGRSQRMYPSKDGAGLECHSGPGWGSETPVELTVSFHADPSGAATGLSWKFKDEPASTAAKIRLREKYVKFRSGNIRLRGKLVLPPEPGPHPAVVIVHGSEKVSATKAYFEPLLFASQGIACFVFDKRGTGESGGKFTMDFYKLAGDVVAAVDCLKQQSEIDSSHIGLAGYSQGGWVAPLAASRCKTVKFVLVGYGLAESPLGEDRSETMNAVSAKGYGDEELEKASQVISAVHVILSSNLSRGWDTLGELKKKYRREPWVKCLDAGMSGPLVKHSRFIMTNVGKHFFPRELIWDYDTVPVLERLDVPMLWILGGGDREAPSQKTIVELERLRGLGRPIEMTIYPNAGHGIIEFDIKNGKRFYTGFPRDYFQLETNWVRGQSGMNPEQPQ